MSSKYLQQVTPQEGIALNCKSLTVNGAAVTGGGGETVTQQVIYYDVSDAGGIVGYVQGIFTYTDVDNTGGSLATMSLSESSFFGVINPTSTLTFASVDTPLVEPFTHASTCAVFDYGIAPTIGYVTIAPGSLVINIPGGLTVGSPILSGLSLSYHGPQV